MVRRFQNLPALFWDYSGGGEAIFAELQSALPHLEWADYASAQAGRPPVPAPPAEQRIALTFIYDGSRLEARDPYFRIIHTYGTTTAPTAAGRANYRHAAGDQPGYEASAPACSRPELCLWFRTSGPAARDHRLSAIGGSARGRSLQNGCAAPLRSKRRGPLFGRLSRFSECRRAASWHCHERFYRCRRPPLDGGNQWQYDLCF